MKASLIETPLAITFKISIIITKNLGREEEEGKTTTLPPRVEWEICD